MKIMSRDFTVREKIMLLVLTLILLAVGYYLVVDQPIRTAINEAKSQQEELSTEMMLLQTKAASLSRMQSELDSIEQGGSLGKMGSYNNSKAELDELVEKSLRGAAIWDEVKDRLKKNALGLSGGQQQRLCIARALAVEPSVLLMDEPTSALDPISTSKIEELATELKKRYTIVIVTHNMQQALRISDNTAFFLLGELVEHGDTETMFSTPREKRTEDYITGRFG